MDWPAVAHKMAIEAVQARRTLGITVKATGPLMMKMKRADE